MTTTPTQEAPDTEHYKLYEFQQVVIDKFKNTKAVLIGDDMGLGKTLEAIDLDWQRRLVELKRAEDKRLVRWNKPTLILTRMSIAPEWENHYGWMLPHLRVVVLQPKDRVSFLKAIRTRTADIYIMHWDALRLLVDPKRDPDETMRKTQWFHIIGDEIHYIKSRKAQVTRALKKLKTEYKTGLSGTPADNKPSDLWSVLNWLYPDNFRSYWNFYRAYVDYEVAYNGQGSYHKITGVRNAPHLHKQMAPFYIRRRKKEVLKDLPDKYYNTVWVDLSPQQRRAYNDMKKNMLAWVGEQEGKPMAAPIAVTQLLRLQQFAVATVDIEGPIKQRKKSTVFRQSLVDAFRETHGQDAELPKDRRFHKWYQIEVFKYIMVDPSTKLDVAMEIIEDSDEPIVFFSWFKTLINLFGKRLTQAGISHCLLTGDTPASSRGDLVRDFQEGKYKVFAGTISAGGEGITLTRSRHVAFFDRAWSPSKNIQAEDRLHRIGQKNAVQVTDIMARNTTDLGRAQQIQLKWTWLQTMLGDKTFDYQKDLLVTVDKLTKKGLPAEEAYSEALQIFELTK